MNEAPGNRIDERGTRATPRSSGPTAVGEPREERVYGRHGRRRDGEYARPNDKASTAPASGNGRRAVTRRWFFPGRPRPDAAHPRTVWRALSGRLMAAGQLARRPAVCAPAEVTALSTDHHLLIDMSPFARTVAGEAPGDPSGWTCARRGRAGPCSPRPDRSSPSTCAGEGRMSAVVGIAPVGRSGSPATSARHFESGHDGSCGYQGEWDADFFTMRLHGNRRWIALEPCRPIGTFAPTRRG